MTATKNTKSAESNTSTETAAMQNEINSLPCERSKTLKQNDDVGKHHTE